MFKSSIILSFAVAVLLAFSSADAAVSPICDLDCDGGQTCHMGDEGSTWCE
ncbi:small cysteine rich protein SCR50 [Phytophthora infestans T30-4]|uniref:Small cysteine rich protein SCR50 n=2 Tax=Phytophthora infestans TaxID=4787 RepID=D0NXU8_PHYIT|nr:small cysteine rich protein SCR50 [Phytophthora infestans T30-4]AAN31504.1 small cysteine rich protein SCR50 [Phytophthora infestans]EEY67899.1 small cysteine rich protein SCR50 [Phytophthora infestans T30-4]QBC18041.1 effector protein [Phytophthora infestans]QBC18042.1 effector protein [Phytophthora infestans]QBC18043.1 effector protein [Phytophthora infestans]|eukprot:XP_002997761.1 small cysteine rich protein SCR50 [Phytophthora infestans T30-4]